MLLQSLIVYLTLLAFMAFFAYRSQYNGKKLQILFTILGFAIVFGCRYGVGVDMLAYKRIYDQLLQYGTIPDNIETGYVYLMELCTYFNCHYSVYFTLIAFLQILFSILALRNSKEIWSWYCFALILCCQWLSLCNGMRQALAYSIFAYALTFIPKRKWLIHYSLIIIMSTIHKSALVLLPIYPLLTYRKNWFNNIKLQLLLLAVSLILMKVGIISTALSYCESIINALGYNGYLDSAYASKVSKEVSAGIGFIITILIFIFCICYSNKVKKFYADTMMPYFYNLFFVGVILKYLFISSQLFSRVNWYFLNFDVFIIAFTLAYLHKTRNNMFYILLCLCLLTFVAVILRGDENTAYFYFFWQQNLYR